MLYSIKKGERLKTIHSDGKQYIAWGIKMWGIIDTKDERILFKEVNDLLSRLSPEEEDDLWEQLCRIREVLHTNIGQEETDDAIVDCCNTVLRLFTESEVREYIKKDCSIFLDEHLKNPSKTYSVERTYNVDQYNELVMLTIYVKLLMPIIGQCAAFYRNDVGVERKEMEIMEKLMQTDLSKMPGILKLLDYCKSWAETKELNSASSVTYEISSADIYFLYLSKIVTNRLPQAYIQVKDTTIVRSI